MKRLIVCVAAFFAAAVLSAYNPPAGGQSMYTLSAPTQLSSASSVAGGGIYYPAPDSIAFNPALPATEQRITLDTDFTALVAGGFHSAVQTGILIPTKMFVASGLLQGVFLNSGVIDLDNSLNLKAGLSKEVTERISVGFDVTTGVTWGGETDWAIGGGLGVLYRQASLGILKDFRIGVSVLNLGKYFNNQKARGIRDKNEDDAGKWYGTDTYPAVATVRTGAATLFVDSKHIKFGASFDISAATFQNLMLDAGLQLGIRDVLFINVAEHFDLRETLNGYSNFIPAIGLGVKFNFTPGTNEYLKSRSWETSEMLVSGAWQQQYEAVQAISGGVKIKLGQKDTTAPSITIWDGEEE